MSCEVREDQGPFGRPVELPPAWLGLPIEVVVLECSHQDRALRLGQAFILHGGGHGAEGTLSEQVGLEPMIG
jgi:hypothetical protein